MSAQVFSAPVETVRKRKLEATQRLLGDTIGMGDEDWRAASLLPGWTRAHVAAHVCRGADALVRLVSATLRGLATPLYPRPDRRFAEIERGVDRSGLQIQIDLDTSAGELNRTLDLVTDWSTPVELLDRSLTLAQVPLARLQEVVLHHLDLNCGFTVDDLDPVPARWLLQWHVALRHPPHGRRLVVESDSGVSASLGDEGPAVEVRGTDAHLWGWLTGRTGPDAVDGADGLRLPLL